MLSKIIRMLISLLGFILGITSYLSVVKYFPQISFGIDNKFLVGMSVELVAVILLYLISPWIFKKMKKSLDKHI